MIKNYANKVMDYEYNTFMTLMHVSVSKHLFDEHFTVLWANDYFYELIGYEKEEYEALFHNHVDEFYKDNPDAVAYMAQIITDAYQKNEAGYEFECPMKIKGGTTVWIQVTGRFTDELFEGIPVIYTIYTDITKLKEMQLELEERSQQLSETLEMAEKANRAKSDFLSRMSHDIRTPMNAIIGMTDIAAAHINEPRKIQDCLKKIYFSSHHLLGLINDVLDMSKIESGSMSLNMENMSLPVVLENVVTIMQPVFKEKGQHFSIRLKHVEHEDFVGDSLRLSQIFINILSNASKFTPENGFISFEVRETVSDKPNYALLQFTFSDSGMGIKPEFLPHIFDAFTRQHDSRTDKTEGSGLGMAIVKKLTDLFDGSIHVESQFGKGSTFYLKLPMKILSNSVCQGDYKGVKILVVDNDDMVCEHIVQELEELNVSAYWSNNGVDAIDQILQAHSLNKDFDMVLLDWQMPGMDGVQITRAIREKIGCDLPILIASAYDWGDIEKEALASGVNGFLQKPLFKSTLCWGIQSFVLKQKAPQKKAEKHFFKGKRFLLVEDNAINREIAVELLSDMEATVEIACNGIEGIAKFSESSEGYYDLILMDIQMPKMNGYDATRRIRTLSRPDAVKIPIVAMTADAFAEDIAAAKESGMNGHLAKPLDSFSMNREISKYL